MELRFLGSVEVWASGRQVPAGPPQQRSVLAALAVDVCRPVLLDAIVERVWSQAPPSRARNAIYVYVSQLRVVLREASDRGNNGARLVRSSGGYLLDVDPDVVDLHRFHNLIVGARESDCRDLERAEALRRALDLWRGDALADLRGEWAQGVRQAWNQLRLDAFVLWAQAELRLGNGAAIVAPLVGLVNEYPLAESLAAALMQALHATGCSAQALDFYAGLRRRLAEQLGTDPAVHLQKLHQTILRGEGIAS